MYTMSNIHEEENIFKRLTFHLDKPVSWLPHILFILQQSLKKLDLPLDILSNDIVFDKEICLIDQPSHINLISCTTAQLSEETTSDPMCIFSITTCCLIRIIEP